MSDWSEHFSSFHLLEAIVSEWSEHFSSFHLLEAIVSDWSEHFSSFHLLEAIVSEPNHREGGGTECQIGQNISHPFTSWRP